MEQIRVDQLANGQPRSRAEIARELAETRNRRTGENRNNEAGGDDENTQLMPKK